MSAKDSDSSLNVQQKRFVEEYLKDLNATQAALRAGYSENSARQTGSELLSKPAIQEAIQYGIERRSKRTAISQDRVIRELASIAFGNITKILSWDEEGRVQFKPSSELDEEDQAFVESIQRTVTRYGRGGDETEVVNLSLKTLAKEKVRALELLGRHLGMFQDHEPPAKPKTLTLSYSLSEDKKESQE